MKQFNVFDELMQGFKDLKKERDGNRILRNLEIATLPLTTTSPPQIIAIPEKLK